MKAKEQRRQVVEIILKSENLAKDVDVSSIAKLTEGFSGSDLRELCRTAAVYAMRDSLKSTADRQNPQLQEITQDHFLLAFSKLRESKINCGTLVSRGIDLD